MSIFFASREELKAFVLYFQNIRFACGFRIAEFFQIVKCLIVMTLNLQVYASFNLKHILVIKCSVLSRHYSLLRPIFSILADPPAKLFILVFLKSVVMTHKGPLDDELEYYRFSTVEAICAGTQY
jgi:hypothetical protein